MCKNCKKFKSCVAVCPKLEKELPNELTGKPADEILVSELMWMCWFRVWKVGYTSRRDLQYIYEGEEIPIEELYEFDFPYNRRRTNIFELITDAIESFYRKMSFLDDPI
jgi:NAD-dependent dihydropyrimidine dehydrogenase PreA subunit